jgi:hypothetical protein
MYFVAALLGLAGRWDWVTSPDWLQEPWVIGGALVLAAVELVVDKVAWLDSAWDAVHTVLRPIAGAAVFSATGDDGTSVGAVATGALLALSAHAAKASVRAAVNASPEPVSNVVVSTTEDGLVAGLMALAIAFPTVALVVTGVLVVASIATAVMVVRTARRMQLRLRARRIAQKAQQAAARAGPPPPPGGPPFT